MTGEPVKAAIWARVSTRDQETDNQLYVLREWAQRRGLDIAAEIITEDSAWANGNGVKGREFDAARAALLDGARLGNYTVILVWAIDRLSRRGIEDTLATLRRLSEAGCVVWSRQESWAEELRDPRMRELFLSIAAWMAEMESGRRSERIKAGLERRKREGKPVGGANSKRGPDRRRRSPEGYEQTWAAGGAHYEDRKAKRDTLLADPVRLRELHRDTECGTCGAGIGDPCRIAEGRLKGEIKSRPHAARLHAASEEQRKTGEG